MCSASASGAGKSAGSAPINRVSAAGPPVDVPTTTSRGPGESTGRGADFTTGCTGPAGRTTAAAAVRTLATSSAPSS